MKHNSKFDPEQNRNMLIALALAGLIMFAFEVFYNQPIRQQQALQKQQAAAMLAEQQNAGKTDLLADLEKTTIALDPKQIDQSYNNFLKERKKALKHSSRVKIDNGELHGSINLQGARIDDITLAKYKVSLEKNSPEFVLASPSNSFHSSFVETGWLSSNPEIVVPNSKTVWELAEGEALTQTTPVLLKWDGGQDVVFYKKISIDEKFMFTVEDIIDNKTTADITLVPYGLISKKRPQGIEEAPLGVSDHNGALTIVEDALSEISYDEMTEKGAITQDAAKSWLGITDKYWLKAIVPADKSFKASFRYSGAAADKFQADFAGKENVIAAGEKASYKNHVFIGAKKLKTLEGYAEKFDIHLFDRAVNFGSLYFLAEPLYHLLLVFYGLVGNWGIAIIMLTFCVKLVLFPLSRKAYISMGKLKILAPKLKEIQDKHKDDRAKLSQEMMAMYKREGVNPAAGCLPILLQIPFFIALYRLIYTAIEMRHAPFYGWIHDLSAPDPTSFWNLFGLLPYDSPAFLAIGIWPLIMCITMFLQQALNPAPTDPMQAKLIKAMPLLFLFMFHSFPAGLIIYWSFSNIITFLQQLYFTRRLQEKKI